MSEGNSAKRQPVTRQGLWPADLENRVVPNTYKSRGERKIAGLLYRYGIPFIYERPVAVQDAGKTKIWYGDFYLSCGLLIEYFGIDGEQSYRERTKHKLHVYAQNGINVIPVYPQDLEGRWEERLLARIDRSLDNILTTYRVSVAQHYQKDSSTVAQQYLGLR